MPLLYMLLKDYYMKVDTLEFEGTHHTKEICKIMNLRYVFHSHLKFWNAYARLVVRSAKYYICVEEYRDNYS
jgi:hypothetical protein